ncbi:hypothetical protein ILUMI_00105 [Ignelater luminosus]|uniref:Glycine cleavage system H protein n=1 Tax=Ignelater luminosus TaxID=2038154 RepID=A0A8K0DMZ2_IGNLU|nr:hypothetical protein ILUMI_00105 [Ignelater luminosus]
MVISRVVVRAARLVNKSPIFNQITTNSSLQTVRLISTSRCNLAERFYTDKHEWVQVEGKIGVIGISQYAQEALGDVVYAQLPDVDTQLKQKDECGALESVKAASELFSPVSGRVIEKNTEVEDSPSLINTSCYEKGWLFKVELTNKKEISALMNEAQYTEFLKSDHH